MHHRLRQTVYLLTTLLAISTGVAEEQAKPFVKKGTLLLTDDFSKAPIANRQNEKWQGGWKRKGVFGVWTSLGDGTIRVENVPEQGHGPVTSYWKPVKNMVVECEFRLPDIDGPGQHFRIFLNQHLKGHTIAAWANISSDIRPLGVTLLHYPTAEKKDRKKVNFGTTEVTITPGKWHLMRLEVLGARVRLTVGDTIVEGTHPGINVAKKNIGLNLGDAGGELRNFRVWEALPDKM